MYKKVFPVLLAGLLTASLAGCGGGGGAEQGSPSGAQTEGQGAAAAGAQIIKYWYPWGGDSETWDKWRMEEFEKNNEGYRLEATYVPPDAGITNGKLLAAIAAKDVPDVICAPNTLTYPLAAQGAFEEVTEYMKELGRTPADYQDSVQSLMDIGGKWYILPMETDTVMLFINNEMAKAAGLDPANPPKTISELDEWARKMTVTEGDNISTMGFIPWIDAGDITYNYAWYFNAPLYQDGKLNLTDENFRKVFEWEAAYAQQYNPEKIKSFTSGFGGAFSPDHAFFSGKVAMTMNGNWFQQAIKQYAKDLDFSLHPMPVSDSFPERYGGSVLNVNTYCIPKGAKNPAGACLFVDYIANATIADDNNKTWYSTPTRKDVIDGLTLVKENDPQYSVIKEMVFNPNSSTPALCSIRNVMEAEILSLRDQVLYENKDPGELLAALQTKMESELAKTDG